jgi:hypothetical protein
MGATIFKNGNVWVDFPPGPGSPFASTKKMKFEQLQRMFE